MRTFIPYEQNHSFLLPPDLREWLPEGFLALDQQFHHHRRVVRRVSPVVVFIDTISL